MLIKEIMTSDVDLISPEATLAEAAKKTKSEGIGILPVRDQDKLVGMLSDRDIVLNSTAAGQNPTSATVRDAMHKSVLYVFEDDDVDDVAQNMASNKVRRMPVLSHDKRLVGIVSIGDIAASRNGKSAASALHDICSAA